MIRMELPHLPVGFLVHRGRARARRIDEVMRTSTSLIGNLKKRRKVDDACTAMSISTECNIKDEGSVMANYPRVGAEHMSACKQLSVVLDGSTLAKKDFWLIAAYDPKQAVGM